MGFVLVQYGCYYGYFDDIFYSVGEERHYMTLEIKLCPYCWGDAGVENAHGRYYVSCDDNACWATGGNGLTPEEAVKVWNEVSDCMKCRLSPHSKEYIKACGVKLHEGIEG